MPGYGTTSATLDKDTKDGGPLLGRTSPLLSYFCVYNPSLSQSEENTKDQILYYTAKKVVPADIKMKQVGLAQALVNVTSTFPTSRSTENVHSQRNRMVFYQPEPGFWMHMCVELGILRRQIKDHKGKEKLVTEYLDTELNDRALSAVLHIGYEQFKLLNGTMGSILYDNSDAEDEDVNRQRTRTLMHAIEEFFSTWIWQWDFDRLDTMVFGAVFNGIPSQPILRSNYLNIHDFDLAVQKQFRSVISHLLVLDDEGSFVYRSPTLDLLDVLSLRKYILKRLESYTDSMPVRAKESEKVTLTKKEKGASLKSLTKSLSQANIFGYFTTSTSTTSGSNVPSTDQAATSSTLTSASVAPVEGEHEQDHAKDGVYLTGLVNSTMEDLNGDEHTVTRTDIVRVYLNSHSGLEEGEEYNQGLTEYILVIYKDASNLVWSFLLPSFEQDVIDLVSDADFYHSLERSMTEQGVEKIRTCIWQNIQDGQKRSLNLGKHYKCFYYDNTTLDMKSTIVDQQGRVMIRTVTTTSRQEQRSSNGLPISNEMLLQILGVKDDLDVLSHSDEIYTRSTLNHWIVGKRIYSRSPFHTITSVTAPTDSPKDSDGHNHDHEAPPDESPVNEHIPFDPSDYSEIYLVAAKKDVSLADVEDNIQRVTHSLQEVLHYDE